MFDICKRHEAAGEGTAGCARRRRPGEGRRLEAVQEAALRKPIINKTSDQLKSEVLARRRATEVSLDELGKLPLVISTRPNTLRLLVETALAAKGVKPVFAFEVDGAPTMAQQRILDIAMPLAHKLLA